MSRELARRSVARIVVLDPREPGQGATQASAGMLAPYSEAIEGGPLLDLTVRGLHAFDPFLADLRAESTVDVPYQRTGLLEVATRRESMTRIDALARALEARGAEATVLDRAGVLECEPQLADGVVGGLLIPAQGSVSPRALHAALVAAATARGVRFERARATKISGSEGSTAALFVETTAGRWSADAVVMAAGSWSGQIEIAGASLDVPVKPVRGQLLALDWPAPALRRVAWNERCYLVPGSDRTLLVGATVEDVGFDERNTVAGVGELLAAVHELVPRASGAAFREARVGLRPGTTDGLPIIGPSSVFPRLIFATGHYRNGILLAPLTAELVAAAVVDAAVDPMLHAVRPSRFGRL